MTKKNILYNKMPNPTLYDNFSRVKDWAVDKFADKEQLAYALSDVAFSGDYNDLINTPDLSTYITGDELSSMGYLTSIPDEYITQTELSECGYLTSIPAEYITQAELSANSYLTQEVLSSMSYITQNDLSAMTYATTAYVMEKVTGIIDGAPEALDTLNELAAAINDDANFASTVATELGKKIDSSYVYTKDQINAMSYITMANVSACGYITSVPDEYITQDELSAMGYVTSIPGYYVTETELDSCGYITMANVSACGYLTSIPSEYITDSELSGMSYIIMDDVSACGYITMSDVSECAYVTALTQNEMDTLFPITNS